MRRILPMLLALTLLPLRLTAQVDDEFRRFQERERRALERFASREDSAFAAFLEREWKAFEGFASGRPYTAPKPASPPRAPAPPTPPAPPAPPRLASRRPPHRRPHQRCRRRPEGCRRRRLPM